MAHYYCQFLCVTMYNIIHAVTKYGGGVGWGWGGGQEFIPKGHPIQFFRSMRHWVFAILAPSGALGHDIHGIFWYNGAMDGER